MNHRIRYPDTPHAEHAEIDRLQDQCKALRSSRDRLRELVQAQAAYASLMYQVPPPGPALRMQAADRMQTARDAVAQHGDLEDTGADH